MAKLRCGLSLGRNNLAGYTGLARDVGAVWVVSGIDNQAGGRRGTAGRAREQLGSRVGITTAPVVFV